MDQLKSQSDEQEWLEARAAELTVTGRARQRSQAERFEQRRREDEAALHLIQFAAFVIVVCLLIILGVFAPILWDALTHYLHRSAPALLAVVAAPRVAPLTNIVRCRYCTSDIPVVGPPQPVNRALIEEYSEGCLCRLGNSVLKGLLTGDAQALRSFRSV
jgi:hypothetical protein